ncbi:MAG: DUF4270 family protein [Flavobacteriales bacterium]|nr:DUF4270 family protein [Flavobacteriales bacterium]
MGYGASPLADNASFLAFFKGLSVVPDETGQSPSTGGIWRFNLLNGASKMTLYYHDGAGVNSSFDFIIGSSGVRYTYAKFDRSSATGITQALSDTSQGQQVTYIQAMGGLRPEIRFPYLDRYANSPYQTLAKAELIVSVANDDTASYPPPSLLYPLRKDADGIDRFLPDQDPGLGVLGGFYEAETKEYHFNLTRSVQGDQRHLCEHGPGLRTGQQRHIGEQGSPCRTPAPGPPDETGAYLHHILTENHVRDRRLCGQKGSLPHFDQRLEAAGIPGL